MSADGIQALVEVFFTHLPLARATGVGEAVVRDIAVEGVPLELVPLGTELGGGSESENADDDERTHFVFLRKEKKDIKLRRRKWKEKIQ